MNIHNDKYENPNYSANTKDNLKVLLHAAIDRMKPLIPYDRYFLGMNQHDLHVIEKEVDSNPAFAFENFHNRISKKVLELEEAKDGPQGEWVPDIPGEMVMIAKLDRDEVFKQCGLTRDSRMVTKEIAKKEGAKLAELYIAGALPHSPKENREEYLKNQKCISSC